MLRLPCRSSLLIVSAGSIWRSRCPVSTTHCRRKERAKTGILASNYGQAGAIDVLGAKYGLPSAISGHQNYWFWGPRGYTGEEMIVMNQATLDEMNAVYNSCIVVGERNGLYTMPWERGPIYLVPRTKEHLRGRLEGTQALLLISP